MKLRPTRTDAGVELAAEIIGTNTTTTRLDGDAVHTGTSATLGVPVALRVSAKAVPDEARAVLATAVLPRLVAASLTTSTLPSVLDHGIDPDGRVWVLSEGFAADNDIDRGIDRAIDNDVERAVDAGRPVGQHTLLHTDAGPALASEATAALASAGLTVTETQLGECVWSSWEPNRLMSSGPTSTTLITLSTSESGVDPTIDTILGESAGTEANAATVLASRRIDALPERWVRPTWHKWAAGSAAALLLAGVSWIIFRPDPPPPALDPVRSLSLATTSAGGAQITWDGESDRWDTWLLSSDRSPEAGSAYVRGRSLFLPKSKISAAGTCVAVQPGTQSKQLEHPEKYFTTCTKGASINEMRRS